MDGRYATDSASTPTFLRSQIPCRLDLQTFLGVKLQSEVRRVSTHGKHAVGHNRVQASSQSSEKSLSAQTANFFSDVCRCTRISRYEYCNCVFLVHYVTDTSDYALCCILIVLIAVHLTVEALNTFYLLYFPPPPLSLSLGRGRGGCGGI